MDHALGRLEAEHRGLAGGRGRERDLPGKDSQSLTQPAGDQAALGEALALVSGEVGQS